MLKITPIVCVGAALFALPSGLPPFLLTRTVADDGRRVGPPRWLLRPTRGSSLVGYCRLRRIQPSPPEPCALL
eukprot:3634219-Alexandrium_andersonii.AAC.1